MSVADVIPIKRITDTNLVLICFYFPLGLFLVLFRICLTVNFFCSQLVFNLVCSKDNVVRRTYEKVVLAILGVVVVKKNSANSKSILISNMLTKVDGIFISILINSVIVNQSSLPKFVKQIFRLHASDDSSNQLLYPESHPTGGNSLLKFSRIPSSTADMQIQPVSVQLKRFLPIKGTTLESTMWSDWFWMYFSLLSLYEVTFLPAIHKQADETSSQFAGRIRQNIADELGVSCSSYDESDVTEFIRRRRFEARKPQEHLRTAASASPLVREMAQQVKDILPHVPTPIIIKDIEKTRSVDVTVTNLLEGVVKFVPEPQSPPQPSFKHQPSTSASRIARSSKPSVDHLTTFEARKVEFINQARENYLRKHNLL